MQKITNFLKSNLIGHKIDIFGKQDLLMTSQPFYFFLALQIIYNQVIYHNAWLTTFIIYPLLIFLDEVLKLDLKNPTEKQRKQLEKNDWYFQMCLFIPMAFGWYSFFYMMDQFSTLEFTFWNCYNLPALMLMTSNLEGVQMVIAHEVYHKPGRLNKIVGTLHMIKNQYMHFSYEHLYGHHRRVATPEDPASAPKGMTIYEFVPKSFLGTYADVYRMEKDEQKKPFYANYAVLNVVCSIILVGILLYCYNVQAVILYMIQNYLAIFFVESVNYLEHYGLRRKKLANGQYQKVTIRHSWNAPHRFTNYLLFKLQRHSDHHENSNKPYQTLLTLDQSPQLPHGYGLTILTAFFPNIWFRIMDPLVDSYNQVDDEITRKERVKIADQELKRFWMKMTLIMFALWAVTWLK